LKKPFPFLRFSEALSFSFCAGRAFCGQLFFFCFSRLPTRLCGAIIAVGENLHDLQYARKNQSCHIRGGLGRNPLAALRPGKSGGNGALRLGARSQFYRHGARIYGQRKLHRRGSCGRTARGRGACHKSAADGPRGYAQRNGGKLERPRHGLH